MPTTKEQIMAARQNGGNVPSADSIAAQQTLAAMRARQFGGMGQVASAQVNGQGSPAGYKQVQTEEPQQQTTQEVTEPTVTTQTGNADGTGVQPPQQNFVQWLQDQQKKNEEQRKVDEKKQKRDQMFAAIGDGISALSNLYFTTKGAPNSFNPNQTMSDRTREMYDKINKDREDRNNAYFNQYMQAANADNANGWRLADFAYKQGRDAIADANNARDYDFRVKEAEANRQERAAARQEQKEERAQARQDQKDARDQAQKNWEKQFDESQRHAKAVEANGRLSATRPTGGRSGSNPNFHEFNIGGGKMIRISKERYNDKNIGDVFNELPEEVKNKYLYEPVMRGGKPAKQLKKDANGNVVKDANGKPVYEPIMKKRKITTNEMLQAISLHAGGNENVRKKWKEIGGEIVDDQSNSQQTDWSSYEVGQGVSGAADWSQFEVK